MESKLTLPSSGREITFREVTVQDSLDLSSMNPDMEERAATWWLNTLQTGEVFDSREWSQEDRTLGLIYLFFLTQDDVKRRVSYSCDHCGERHTFTADYAILAQREVKTLESWPEIPLLEGQYQLRPLRGSDMEELEQMRLSTPTPTDSQIRFAVIAKRLGADPEELKSLSLTSYSQLIKEAESHLDEMEHGVSLRTTHECPEKGGETNVSLPFQINDYLPRL